MTDFLELLSREADNKSSIYLYPEAEGWCAYERSAYLLNQVVEQCTLQKIVNCTYEVILIRLVLNDGWIDNPALTSKGIHLCNGGFIEIPQDAQSEELFERWKENTFGQLNEVVEIQRT